MQNENENALENSVREEQDSQLFITPEGLDIRGLILRLEEEYERPECILRQDSTGAPLMTAEGLSLVLGPPKCRKTSLCVGMVAALLGHPLLGPSSPAESRPLERKVLIIDAEQGKGYGQLTYRKVHKLMGWDDKVSNPRLVYMDFRPLSRQQRREALTRAVEALRPQVVVLDGVVDICQDYNDQKDCAEVVGQLVELAGKCHTHICSCLHTNKDGRTERGALGAMYKQKAETTILLKGYEEFSVAMAAEGAAARSRSARSCSA
ncbi:MAG: AAA family ATPase [Prevotellaceae bacterium]|nr:AAA family ATPase [Prevotellaceae bacterium]